MTLPVAFDKEMFVILANKVKVKNKNEKRHSIKIIVKHINTIFICM